MLKTGGPFHKSIMTLKRVYMAIYSGSVKIKSVKGESMSVGFQNNFDTTRNYKMFVVRELIRAGVINLRNWYKRHFILGLFKKYAN